MIRLHMPANQKIAYLAYDSHHVSQNLEVLAVKFSHEGISTEVCAIAKELAQLSATLDELEEAISTDLNLYTAAFNEDLDEIATELVAVLVELRECCTKLRELTINTSVVAWFFRKGHVAHFMRHLKALRGTLLVMRTVLWHGKEYGRQQ